MMQRHRAAGIIALVAVAFAAARRINRRCAQTPGAGRSSVSEVAAQTAAALAHEELNAELTGADSDDVKALGFLAVDIAAVALIVSVRRDLDRYWFWTVIGLGASAVLLFGALWRRTFKTGPVPDEFYETAASAGDAEQVALLALEGLAVARTHNERVRRNKGRWYKASLVALAVTAVGGGIYLPVVH